MTRSFLHRETPRYAVIAFGAIALGAFTPRVARAQTTTPPACPAVSTAAASGTTVTANLCMQVLDVLQMTQSGSLSGQTITRSSYRAASDPVNWVPYGGSLAFNVASNRPFALTVSGQFASVASYTKSPADVVWSTTSGTWDATKNLAAAESNRTILSASSANAVTSTVFFASKWIWGADRSGTYALTLAFTLAAK